jgi:hypothetical protein
MQNLFQPYSLRSVVRVLALVIMLFVLVNLFE